MSDLRDHDRRPAATAERPPLPVAPAAPGPLQLAGAMGNQAFAQALARPQAPPRGVVHPQLGALLGAASGPRVARQAPASEPVAAPEAAGAGTGARGGYEIGGVIYARSCGRARSGRSSGCASTPTASRIAA